MADLVVVVPSRNRPLAVEALRTAFKETCTAGTELRVVVDRDDPMAGLYAEPKVVGGHRSMVDALNREAMVTAGGSCTAIAFMGDDHRPRTVGWDAAYLEMLKSKPGLVFGNDLVQGGRLPTQVAMSASLVRALGHMAPPTLTHLYVDNYWLALGVGADCITYLPDVVVEHLHPSVGTAPVDDGYLRVNNMAMFSRDESAFADYWEAYGARDIEIARGLAVASG